MRKFKITVEGEAFEVEVEELGGVVSRVESEREKRREIVRSQSSVPAAPSSPKPSPPPAAPTPTAPSTDRGTVTAPMPGTIISIHVKVGGEVKKGDTLLMLDAMKVQNEIHAPRDGKVKELYVSEGTYVKTKQALVALE